MKPANVKWSEYRAWREQIEADSLRPFEGSGFSRAELTAYRDGIRQGVSALMLTLTLQQRVELLTGPNDR